jgi:hypothetical protein
VHGLINRQSNKRGLTISLKAQCKVVVNAQTHQPYVVVVHYDSHEFVAEVKKLIVAKLKACYDGFDSVKSGYLTLKALNGDVIMEGTMPEGNKFLAELSRP